MPSTLEPPPAVLKYFALGAERDSVHSAVFRETPLLGARYATYNALDVLTHRAFTGAELTQVSQWMRHAQNAPTTSATLHRAGRDSRVGDPSLRECFERLTSTAHEHPTL